MLTIINSFGNCVKDHVHKREIYPGNVEMDKNLSVFSSVAFRSNPEK